MEFWALAAVSVGTAAVGAYASSRSASKGQKNQQKHEVEAAREAAEQGRISTMFERDLLDYDVQLAKERKRNARTNTTDKFSPLDKPIKRESMLVAKPDIPKPFVEPILAEPAKGKKKEGILKKASGLRKLKKLF